MERRVKIPESVLVVIHSAELDVLLIERADMPRPLPWQVGHGSSYTSWRPPQAGQVSFMEKAPPTEAVTKQ